MMRMLRAAVHSALIVSTFAQYGMQPRFGGYSGLGWGGSVGIVDYGYGSVNVFVASETEQPTKLPTISSPTPATQPQNLVRGKGKGRGKGRGKGKYKGKGKGKDHQRSMSRPPVSQQHTEQHEKGPGAEPEAVRAQAGADAMRGESHQEPASGNEVVVKEKEKKKKKKKKAKYLWDQDTLHAFNFIISDKNLDKLDQSPASEEYVPCSVQSEYSTAEEALFEGVGCRYKGSVGSLRICLDAASGRFDEAECRKLSWKINSDKFLPDGVKQEIFGQDRLNFHGMPVDLSLMTERVAYTTLAELNIPGPLSSHVQLYINGVYDGVYNLLEDPDEEFTKRVFERDARGGRGALYKEALLRSASPEYYQSKQQSGVDEFEFMVEVAGAIEAAGEEQYEEVLTKYIDLGSMVDMIAFNAVLGSTDDWRMRRNFYWYVHVDEETKDKRLVMVPWDYDRLNDPGRTARVSPHATPNWYDPLDSQDLACLVPDLPLEEKAAAQSKKDPASYEFWLDYYLALPEDIGKPINCDKFAVMLAKVIKDRSIERTQEIAAIVTSEYLREKMNKFAEQISDAVIDDPDPPSATLWPSKVKELRMFFRQQRALALNPVEYLEGSGGAGVFDPEFLKILGSTASEIAEVVGIPNGDMESKQKFAAQLLKNPSTLMGVTEYMAGGKTGFLTGPSSPAFSHLAKPAVPATPAASTSTAKSGGLARYRGHRDTNHQKGETSSSSVSSSSASQSSPSPPEFRYGQFGSPAVSGGVQRNIPGSYGGRAGFG